MELDFITQQDFNYILNKNKMSSSEKFRLAAFPYVSLLPYCNYKYTTALEQEKIRNIEEKNIYRFFNVITSLFNEAFLKDETLQNSYRNEPLRTAAIIANQEQDAAMKTPMLIKYSCLILLSLEGGETSTNCPINLKIKGKMPFRPIASKQELGNQWFSEFVDYKLNGFCKVFNFFGMQDAYIFLLRSIAYSLNYFLPAKYSVKAFSDEDSAIRHILKKINNYRMEE